MTVHSVDESVFKAAMGRFCSGITILAARLDDEVVALTCQSFVSHSLEPPLVALSVSTNSRRYGRIRRVERFCVSILAAGHESICRDLGAFSTGEAARLEWRLTTQGGPFVDGALAVVDCVREQELAVGDHYLIIGRVADVTVGVDAAPPLLYYRSGFYRAG